MSKMVKMAVDMAPHARTYLAKQQKVFLHYAKVELVPPSPAELPEAFRHAGRLMSGLKTGAWKHVPLKEAMVNTVVTAEVLCWFWLGEIIGKGKLIGYKI